MSTNTILLNLSDWRSPPSALRKLMCDRAPFNFGLQSVTLITPNGESFEYNSTRGMYLLNPNTEYMIAIDNRHKRFRASAKIIIDGVCVGTFEIPPNSVKTFERPGDANGQFTFVAIDFNLEGRGGLDQSSVSRRGLCVIEVRQATEVEDLNDSFQGEMECGGCKNGLGGTVLGNESGDTYFFLGEKESGCKNGLGCTILGGKSEAKYVFSSPFDTEAVGTCVFKMGLRSRIVPLAGTKVVPLAGTKVVPLAGAKVVPLAGTKVVPQAGTKVVPLAGAKVVPLAGTKVVPLAGAKVVPLAGAKVVPLAGAKVVPLAGAKVVPLAGTASRCTTSRESQKTSTIPSVTAGKNVHFYINE